MRNLYSILVILTTVFTSVQAGVGGQAAPLYRFGAGAHVLGLGGAVVSLAHDPVTTLHNPSGAALTRGGKIVVSQTRLPFDRTINVLGFGRQIDPRAGFTVTWVNAGVDNVMGRDADGEEQESIENSENALSFAFGTRYNKFVGGVAAKWYRIALDDQSPNESSNKSSNNWSLSIGVTILPMEGLRIGASIRDVGDDLSWNDDDSQLAPRKDTFPRTFELGASYTLSAVDVTGAVMYEGVEGEGEYLHFGASWHVVRALTLRAGTRWVNVTDSAREPALTAGASVNAEIDYAIVSFDYAVIDDHLGPVHSFGIRFEL
jgi:hypothetical protein